MAKDILNIDETAEMLSLHPRTIRRYLKDGTLRGTKIGGEWRIHRTDLQTMMGNPEVVRELKTTWEAGVADILAGKQEPPMQGYHICTLVDCRFSGPEEAQTVSSALLSIVNQYQNGNQETHFQYTYQADTGKARFILRGNPEFMILMLQALPNPIIQEET